MDMTISQHTTNVVIIALAGRFDAYGAPQVEKGIKQAIEQGSANVIIDLAAVHFIDSTGLATLVQGMKRCREQQGDLSLSSLQDPVQVIVELTRLDKVFSLFPSQHAALEKFGTTVTVTSQVPSI